MRVVAGRFRGRPLATPTGDAIRPTSDRTREAIFNILAHGIDNFSLEDVKVLDLFAGTGALGIEALSRGARFCLFVEEAAEARALIRRNVEALGLTGVTKIFRRDATDMGAVGGRVKSELAFLDPPYGQGLAERTLGSLARGDWLAAGAILAIEERKGAIIALPDGYRQFDQRTWGDTQVLFVRFEPGVPGS